MPERQADRRSRAAATCRSRSPTSTRRSPRERTRSRSSPTSARPSSPPIQAATAAGVKVVPWGADPGGVDGKDFVQYVDWNDAVRRDDVGELDGQGAARQGQRRLHRRPGRQPGRRRSARRTIVKVFAKHPGMKLLTGNDDWPRHELGSGDGAEGRRRRCSPSTRRSTASSPNYGTDALASDPRVPGGRAEARPDRRRSTRTGSPASTRTRKTQPEFQLATISSRNWLGRIAARKAIAAAEGSRTTEPSRYNLPFFEDTLGGKPTRCLQHRSCRAGLLSLEQHLAGGRSRKYGKP